MPGLPAIGNDFFANYWQQELHGLQNAPGVGGPNGAVPGTPNDRLMEAFGSNNYPYPLMPVDKQINGPKGKLMNLEAPVDLRTITRLANMAVQLDTPEAADALLSEMRIVCVATLQASLLVTCNRLTYLLFL